MLRSPRPTIASIQTLAGKTGMPEFAEPDSAARYYLGRLDALERHWALFKSERRLGILSERLLEDPQSELTRVSRWLGVRPELTNNYLSHAASRSGGGGDPLFSGSVKKIETRTAEIDLGLPEGVNALLARSCVETYERLAALLSRAN
jgi:hypothetical protein